MQKTRIEWTDYSWNPIRGLCPVNCKLPDGKEYCYARRMYKRFKRNPEIRYELDDLKILHDLPGKEYSKIFVCSTFELFHPITNTLLFPLTEGSDITYRDMVFKIIKEHPQHTFQILTKFPQNIDRAMPDNVWLGVTVADNGEMINTWRLGRKKAKIRFISIEPMLEQIDPYMIHYSCNWIIVGRLTGFGHKYNPKKEWIEELAKKAKERKVPIFLKDNLKEIWGEKLIQEFPE